MFKSKHSKILSISAICNLNLAGDIHTSVFNCVIHTTLNMHLNLMQLVISQIMSIATSLVLLMTLRFLQQLTTLPTVMTSNLILITFIRGHLPTT